MNDIRIYDFDFNLLHIEHNIKSAYWTVYYNGIGTFEGTFPLSGALIDVLFHEKYLFLTQGALQAIITGKTADGQITVYGKTPNWILSRRTVPAFKTSEMESEAYEDVVKYVLETAFPEEFASELILTNMVQSDKPAEHFWRNTRNPASDVIRDKLDDLLLGHRVVLDTAEKKWRLELYEGADRPYIVSEANRNVTNVTLSEDMQDFAACGWYRKETKDKGGLNPAKDSLPQASAARYGEYYTFEYEEDDNPRPQYPAGSYYVCADRETGAWKVCSELPELSEFAEQTFSWCGFAPVYSGVWEASRYLPEKKPENYGHYYRIANDSPVIYPDYKDGSYLICLDKYRGAWEVTDTLPEVIPDTPRGMKRWEVSLSADSESEAKTELAKKAWKQTVSGESAGLVLGRDYHLGDTVRLQIEKGGFCETVTKRISGAELWWESGRIGEKLIFKEDE